MCGFSGFMVFPITIFISEGAPHPAQGRHACVDFIQAEEPGYSIEEIPRSLMVRLRIAPSIISNREDTRLRIATSMISKREGLSIFISFRFLSFGDFHLRFLLIFIGFLTFS